MRATVRTRSLFAIGAVAIAAALAGSCGGGEETDILTVKNSVPPVFGARMSALVSMNGRVVTLTSEQIGSATLLGSEGAALRGLPGRGTMTVRFALTKSPTDTIAVGEVPFELTKGFLYHINATIQPGGSSQTCVGGCSGHAKFPLRGSESASTDSMWVYYVNGAPCKQCVF